MGRKQSAVAVLGVSLALALAAGPARAQDRTAEAAQLRRLDIMLMVTSLRCRLGADDFGPEYAAFTARHLATLNDAGRVLQGGRGVRALDTISTTMANRYGTGHPWLDCAALRGVAGQLAAAPDRHHLLAAADELLADSPRRTGLVAAYAP